MYPPTFDFLLKAYEPARAGQARLVDIIVGFIDPNAPDVIAQPQNPTKMELAEAEDTENEEERGKAKTAKRTKKPSTPARIRKRPRAASRRSRRAIVSALAHIAEGWRQGPEDAEGPQEAVRSR